MSAIIELLFNGLSAIGKYILGILAAIVAIASYIFGKDHFLSKEQSKEIEEQNKIINVKDEYEKVDQESNNYRNNGQSGLVERLHDEANHSK